MKLKSLLVFAITILSTTQTQAGSVTSLFDDLNQKLVYLFGVEWPNLTEEQSAAAWGAWSFGLVVGSTTSLTSNMPWDSCLQDVSAIIVNCYSIYVYVYRNVVTNEPAYAIYATSYGIALLGKVAYIRCGENAISLDQALLNGETSLRPGYQSVEQQISAVNQNANFTSYDPSNDSSTSGGTSAASGTSGTSGTSAATYDPWSSNDPWAYKVFDQKLLTDPAQREHSPIRRQSEINDRSINIGTIITDLPQSFQSVSVNNGANCTGAPSDPLACLDKDGDGVIDADYVIQSLNNTMSGATDFSMMQFQNIMGTVAFVSQMIGSFFDIATINSLWIAEQYFDSGLYTGKSLLNMSFQSFKLVQLALDGTAVY